MFEELQRDLWGGICIYRCDLYLPLIVTTSRFSFGERVFVLFFLSQCCCADLKMLHFDPIFTKLIVGVDGSCLLFFLGSVFFGMKLKTNKISPKQNIMTVAISNQ